MNCVALRGKFVEKNRENPLEDEIKMHFLWESSRIYSSSISINSMAEKSLKKIYDWGAWSHGSAVLELVSHAW